MVPSTRRRFLHVATAVAGGLAGCSRLSGDPGQSSHSASENGASNYPDDSTVRDPPVVMRRSESEVPPIYFAGTEDEFDEPSRDRPSARYTHEVIDAQSGADSLVAADAVESAGGPINRFVSETDFDSETLYLESRRVERCFRLHLCRVSWQSDDVHTDYVRSLRPYDERCEPGETAYESRLIRIPAALDADAVTGHGSSVSSGRECGAAGPAGSSGGRDGSRSGQESTPSPTQSPDGGDE